MADMNDRKDAFESKFAHDEELKFKATARRNKLIGLWAAEKNGKSGADADAYAKEVVMADFEEAGDADDPGQECVGERLVGRHDHAGLLEFASFGVYFVLIFSLPSNTIEL